MAVIEHRLLIGTAILVMASGVFGAPAQVKTGAPSPAEKGTLLLSDFKPKSMLHAPVHNVERARFPVIDVHNHVNDARHPEREHLPPQRVIEIMDRCNIQKIVILTGM